MVVRVDGQEWEIMNYDDETFLLFEDTSEIESSQECIEAIFLKSTCKCQDKESF